MPKKNKNKKKQDAHEKSTASEANGIATEKSEHEDVVTNSNGVVEDDSGALASDSSVPQVKPDLETNGEVLDETSNIPLQNGIAQPETSTEDVAELLEALEPMTVKDIHETVGTEQPSGLDKEHEVLKPTDIAATSPETKVSAPFDLQALEEKLKAVTDELRLAQQDLASAQASNQRLTDEKMHVESQYRSLFGKVSQMKTTLGERLKQDAEEISQNRITIEELETQNTTLTETIAHMQDQIVEHSETMETTSKQLKVTKSELEAVTKKLAETEAAAKTEMAQVAEMQERNAIAAAEWENLAIEERSARDALRDRITDLEEQLASQNSAYDNLRTIVDQDNQAITKFKQNIYELQESHKSELRETVEKMQNTISDLSNTARASEDRANSLRTEVQSLNADIDKLRPYEQEAREKNLLIGKLRHEAVILNEHLTKALRLLKRGSSNDIVDRQLLNNLLLSFLTLPRQDSKRFEVLKILGSVLAWTDEQKELAGLLRPGTSGAFTPLSPSSTRSPPMSPSINRHGMSRRTSGSLQLQAADFMGPNRESMSDLWINFLQSEAAAQTAEQESSTPDVKTP